MPPQSDVGWGARLRLGPRRRGSGPARAAAGGRPGGGGAETGNWYAYPVPGVPNPPFESRRPASGEAG